MCGICGFTWRDEPLVKQMAAVMTHRGPDQEGWHTGQGISLGHRRLSIIDLSENGRQPMFNEDRSIAMVFNGEIYNFQELRPSLEAKGHRFHSNSDSEVIIHGYEEYGIDVIHRLRGMFAFAIWDARTREMYLVRDRIGIKPLYYHHQGDQLIFASEIKAILEHSGVTRALNRQALFDYMGFEFVPAPNTMFRDIYKIPAGHYVHWHDGRADLTPYWDLKFNGRPAPRYEEAVEQQRTLLDGAVKSHLISDVPLGVFLSGGLDSSTIVAMMRRHISGPLRTFTIGYEDKTFSELDYAKIVAERFETEHHVLMLDDIRPQYVEKALWHLDEPMTDLSTVPLFLLCQKVKEYVTVCLSGEGADESFAGYDRFKASKLWRYYRTLPRPLREGLVSNLVRRLPDQPQKKGLINMLKRFVEGADLPADGGHLRWQYFSTPGMADGLFNPEFKAATELDAFRQVREYDARCDTTDTINREIYLDMRFMMTDSVLMKVDKMSMASSLEVRVPLLDTPLVEYMAGLPGDWKLKGMNTKHVFRSALEGILPDKIVHRGKQGYSLPVKHLLRGRLKNYMVDLLNDSGIIAENMDRAYVNRLIDEHSSMVQNHNHVLWGLINVAIWHNRFFN